MHFQVFDLLSTGQINKAGASRPRRLDFIGFGIGMATKGGFQVTPEAAHDGCVGGIGVTNTELYTIKCCIVLIYEMVYPNKCAIRFKLSVPIATHCQNIIYV